MRALALRAIRSSNPSALARGMSGRLFRRLPSLLVVALATVVVGLDANAARAEFDYLLKYPGGVGDIGPRGDLTRGPDGTLYFATYGFGRRGWGSVDALSPPAVPGDPWRLERLHDFDATSPGMFPLAGVTLGPDGEVYGTTGAGGSHGVGTVFRLNPPAGPGERWTKDILHEFGSRPGGRPATNLTLGPDGALYGTTDTRGSSDCGAAFRLKPKASGALPWAYKVLARFTPAFGCTPSSALVRDGGGNLYGTLSDRGLFDGGAVFQLAAQPDGAYRLVKLKGFGAGLANPVGLARDASGALVGAAQNGGQFSGCGGAFRLAPPAAGETRWAYDTIRVLGGPTGVCRPVSLASDGDRLIVLTRQGGAENLGTLLTLTPRADDPSKYALRIRESFPGTAYSPRGAPVVGPGGEIYGYTSGPITIWRSGP